MPETGSDEYKAMRLERQLVKRTEEYSPWLFTTLDEDAQHFFLSRVSLEQGELPVFAYSETRETWFLATTRKIAWSRPGFNHHLKYEKIRDISKPEFDKLLGPRGLETAEEHQARMDRIKLAKVHSPWLYFKNEDGIKHEAYLPPGGPLFKVWNMVRFMVSLSQIHPACPGQD